jgi:hypothetical protein
MRFVEDLCPPALLYLIFLVVQVGLDASLGLWATLVVKSILGMAVVLLLDMLCGIELGVVSWFLVAAPFLITALGTSIAIGTQFDAKMLGIVTEKFYDPKASKTDVEREGGSNDIARVTE